MSVSHFLPLYLLSSFLVLSMLSVPFGSPPLLLSFSEVCVCLFVIPQDEDLEAQVSFLQGQINDLEAMSKYCAKMMNSHICEYNRWSNLHVHFQHLKH